MTTASALRAGAGHQGVHTDDRPSTGSRWTAPHGMAFWVVAAAFLLNMAFSAVPTPLYVLYQARDHFSDIMVTVVYAVYAIGVIVSLFLVGHISDWRGAGNSWSWRSWSMWPAPCCSSFSPASPD